MSEFDPDKYLTKKEESGEFNPDEYLQSKADSIPSSKTDTLIGSALQGSTFGFGDELTAAGAAATDIATGDPKLADYKKLYNQYLDSERAQLKKEALDNPKTAIAGNIAGSALTLPLGGSALAPSLKGATMLQGAGKLAGSGALGGTLIGAGTSEANDMSGIAKDAAIGGVEGAGVNLLLGGGMQALGKVPGVLAKLPIVSDAVAAAQGAAQGKRYTGNTDTFQDMLRGAGSDTVQTLKDLATSKFANKNAALKAAKEAGAVADISPQLMEAAESSVDLPAITKEQIKAKKELQRLLNVVSKEKDTVKQNPEELEKLIRQVQGVADVANGASEAQQLSAKLKGNIKNQLGEVVPDLPQLNKESHDVQELMKRLTGVEPGDIRPGMDEAKTAAIKDRVTNILKKAPDSPAKLQDILEGFEGVKGLNTYAPEKASTIKNSVENINKDLRLANIANKKAQGFDGGVLKSVVGNAQTAAVKAGEKIGQSMPGLVNKISSKSPEQLQAMAQKSIQKYGKDGEALANVLNNASDKSSMTRNAVIFGMMQRPEYRMKLNELHDDDEEPQE